MVNRALLPDILFAFCGEPIMQQPSNRTISRRDFHKRAGSVAAATALSTLVVPHVHAAEDNTINLALIGTGGRGTGAAVNALKTTTGDSAIFGTSETSAWLQ